MPRISIARLFDDNKSRLQLAWCAGEEGAAKTLDSEFTKDSSKGLIGHLNFIHPNLIQVLGVSEIQHLDGMEPELCGATLRELATRELACFIVAGASRVPQSLVDAATATATPLLTSPVTSVELMWMLRPYLARALAECATVHGVMLDVLGMGVLITGVSGAGKSELALELISRGSGLVADDVVELYHIAPETLEGRSPELLKDFLEVRGLGMLNIRTIFGETAVRTKKNLKLIVQMEKPVGGVIPGLERLPLNASSEDIMGISVRKVLLPVAAGRNLAVLAEAAVRNYVLQLRGIDSTQEFIQRQEKQLSRRD